jgi:hypothetical protein
MRNLISLKPSSVRSSSCNWMGNSCYTIRCFKMGWNFWNSFKEMIKDFWPPMSKTVRWFSVPLFPVLWGDYTWKIHMLFVKEKMQNVFLDVKLCL